ncbi:TetR/AcrR family transcriptional regulator [Rhodococcus fascians]|nr:TetR/AcrR family transcriptional regulator [Rhodococcus fascians]MBY4238351.1 TetR/AcrR family transcriptional regulator [Rhodococcus fascians]MBY4254268.1 TetR/AcrR family transcriptional regulator [Rhodococcus fascians]MBY4269649.1 TetR/AcrR family transcriptional regulator [Rhodococcus fascians]
MPKIVDHERRRAELADAVLRVIARSGISAVTNKAVAEDAGWSTGVLGHYFGNQHDLLVAALRRAAELQGRIFKELSSDDATPIQRLQAVLESVLPLDERRVALTRIFLFFYAEAASNNVAREEVADFLAGWRRVVRRHAIAAQEDGSLPPVDPTQLATYFVGLADALAMHSIFDPEVMDSLRKNPDIVGNWLISARALGLNA